MFISNEPSEPASAARFPYRPRLGDRSGRLLAYCVLLGLAIVVSRHSEFPRELEKFGTGEVSVNIDVGGVSPLSVALVP